MIYQKSNESSCRSISEFLSLMDGINDLRHTCASRLVQNGMNMYGVSQMLGHVDVLATRRLRTWKAGYQTVGRRLWRAQRNILAVKIAKCFDNFSKRDKCIVPGLVVGSLGCNTYYMMVGI
jgi:hypothetical protein